MVGVSNETQATNQRIPYFPKLMGAIKNVEFEQSEELASPSHPECSCTCVDSLPQSVSPYKLIVVPNSPSQAAHSVPEPSSVTPPTYRVTETAYSESPDHLPSYVLPPASPYL